MMKMRGASRILAALFLVAGFMPAAAQDPLQPAKPVQPPASASPQAAPAAPQQTIRIIGSRSIYSVEEVEQAVMALRTHCQPLGGEQWEDLTDITARVTPEYAPYRQEKGWKTAIHLTAVISRKPRFIPASDRRMGDIAGRTLYFFMGGAADPGVFVSRQIGQFLCGLPGYESGDIEFIPIPELDFLNR